MTKTSPTIPPASIGLQVTDDQLVERARQDLAAFAALYDRYLPSVYRYLYTRVSEGTLAEDLASQVFLAALQAFPKYKHNGHFKAWLLSIARHKAADYYHQCPREIPLNKASGLTSDHPQPLAQSVHSDDLRRLSGLIAQLDEGERELLRLRFAAQLSFSEISQVLKRKQSAVKMALYRLLERLEDQMEAQDDA